MVEYTYDAWGNILSCTGSMAETLGQLNPLRYRGYVYDEETQLYYLQSRYYDPEIGRFINADAFTSTGQGILGNNMYAYCNNNPVLLVDGEGTRPIIGASINAETKDERKASFAYMRELNRSRNSKTSNTGSKIEELAESVWKNIEFSVGVGQGLYGEINILDVASVQIGMYGNYAALCLQNGEFTFGQELCQGISISAYGHNFGVNEYTFTEKGIDVINQHNKWFYTDETLTIASAAFYPTAGVSIRLGFDIVQFCDDLRRIF